MDALRVTIFIHDSLNGSDSWIAIQDLVLSGNSVLLQELFSWTTKMAIYSSDNLLSVATKIFARVRLLGNQGLGYNSDTVHNLNTSLDLEDPGSSCSLTRGGYHPYLISRQVISPFHVWYTLYYEGHLIGCLLFVEHWRWNTCVVLVIYDRRRHRSARLLPYRVQRVPTKKTGSRLSPAASEHRPTYFRMEWDAKPP